MSDLTIFFGALGALIAICVPAFIAWRVARGSAKKADIDALREHYGKLQATYLAENERLHIELTARHNEIAALEKKQQSDRLECQRQIDNLQKQLTTLLGKLPEPGTAQPVIVVGAEAPLAVIIKAPLPLPMTAAEIAKVIEEGTVI